MPIRRTRVVHVALACGLLFAATTTATAHAAPVAAAPTIGYVETPFVSLVSSTGRDLKLGIFTYSGTGSNLEVQIKDPAGEDHLWVMDTKGHTFSYDASTGTGSIDTGDKLIAPLGVIDVDIANAGAPVVKTCASGSQTRQPVTITGTVFFDTQSSTWGTVGSTTDPTTFSSKSYIQENQQGHCGLADGTQPCGGEVGWFAGIGASTLEGDTVKFHGKTESFLDYDQTQDLRKPINATREDMDYLPFSPAKLLKDAQGKRTVRIDAGDTGLFTGSARIVSVGKAKVSTKAPCPGQASRSWNAKFVPGAEPFTVNQDIGGDIIEKTSKAFLERYGTK